MQLIPPQKTTKKTPQKNRRLNKDFKNVAAVGKRRLMMLTISRMKDKLNKGIGSTRYHLYLLSVHFNQMLVREENWYFCRTR